MALSFAKTGRNAENYICDSTFWGFCRLNSSQGQGKILVGNDESPKFDSENGGLNVCEKLALRFPKSASATDVFGKSDDSLANVFR